MFLEKVSISGFRGINHLNLTLDESTLLIGENAWGKSSLFDALMLLLGPTQGQYQFTEQDFFISTAVNNSLEQQIQIDFIFCETQPGQYSLARYHDLKPIGFRYPDSLYRIHYRITGKKQPDGTILTQRYFLNHLGQYIDLMQFEACVNKLIELHPAMRLSKTPPCSQPSNSIVSEQKTALFNQLADDPQAPSDEELGNSIKVMQSLLERYFARNSSLKAKNGKYRYNPSPSEWRSLNDLNQLLNEPQNRNLRTVLLQIFSSLLNNNDQIDIAPQAHPILLVEEPERGLHPIMLSTAWAMLTNLPLQKITTTNSSQLLSLVPVERICRLVRETNIIKSYCIGDRPLSPEDSRRIAFHIRFNRAASLFARCWLLVEGETEVWLLNELARQSDYHLDAEGIKIIEFAQSGLRPLLKFADRMGIEWHVMMDGDEAGNKYAMTAQSQLQHRDEQQHITVLPAQDLEHFLYREGFSYVYKRNAMLPENGKLSSRKIIQKAIHRSSKPDLAIEVAEEAAKRGIASIPHLLRTVFATVRKLARHKEQL